MNVSFSIHYSSLPANRSMVIPLMKSDLQPFVAAATRQVFIYELEVLLMLKLDPVSVSCLVTSPMTAFASPNSIRVLGEW